MQNQKPEMRNPEARNAALVKNRWPRLVVALPANAGGPVNLPFACATDQASFATTLLSSCHAGRAPKGRDSCFVMQNPKTEMRNPEARNAALVKNRWAWLAVAHPGSAEGTVDVSFVCAADQASLVTALLSSCCGGQDGQGSHHEAPFLKRSAA